MSDPSKATRRTVLAGATGATAIGLAHPAAAPAQRRERPRRGTVLAEVVGQLAQDGLELRGFGYVTRLRSVAADQLFDGERMETGARFTWSATAAVEDHFVRGAVRATVATGTLDLFQGTGGGDFADPASFADGTRIASFTARFHDTLVVIAPDQAVTVVEGELRQTRAAGFDTGGRRRRAGRRGARMDLFASGHGTRTDAAVPRAVFDVAGRIAFR